MSTKSVIDRIIPYAPGWSRSTGTRSILRLIEQGQDELFEYDAPYMRYLGTDNEGFPPYLKTQANVFKYEIIPANLSATTLVHTIGGVDRTIRCRRVIKVFVDVSFSAEFGIRWIGRPYVNYFQNPYSNNFDRTMIADVPVDSYPALENTPAYVIFKEDPGTQDERYFVEFVWEPPRLTSENIPLIVPLNYEEALEEYVLGYVQRRSHGRIGESQLDWRNIWVPRFHSEMSALAKSFELRVQTRTS